MRLSLRWKRCLQGAAVVLALFTLTGAEPDAHFQALGHKLMCVCSCNEVLLECNHVGCPLSEGMRAELGQYMSRGDSDGLILEAFVQKYGPTVLIAPPTTGFNRVAWIMPYAVLALGLATAYLVVSAWKKRPIPALAEGIAPVAASELESFRARARQDTEL
jgi:cytochrome c-type biogenesis protein CcmH/NrfF